MSNMSKQGKVRRALFHPQVCPYIRDPQSVLLSRRPDRMSSPTPNSTLSHPQACGLSTLPAQQCSLICIAEVTALRSAVQPQGRKWRVTSASWEASQQQQGGDGKPPGNSVVRGFHTSLHCFLHKIFIIISKWVNLLISRCHVREDLGQ